MLPLLYKKVKIQSFTRSQIQITVLGHTGGIHIETFGNPNNLKLFILHGSVGDYRAWLPYQILSDKYYVIRHKKKRMRI